MKQLGIAFGILSFCFFAWKGFQAGSAMGSHRFDFATATIEQRQAWMEEQAELMGAEVRKNLPRGGGMAPRMTLADTRVSATSRTIHFDIQIKGQAMIRNDAGKAKRAAQRQACPDYLRSPIGQNEIYVYQNFKLQNGRTAMTAALTPAVCERLLKG